MPQQFNRWNHTQSYSWPFRVFKQYYEELNLLYWSIIGTKNYVYPTMKGNGLTWDIDPSAVLRIPSTKYNFESLRGWAKGYDTSLVWTRLNFAMSLNAILETYLSTIVSLSIESDPGLLINAPHSVDGTLFLRRHGGFSREKYDDFVLDITKGTWASRLSAFQRLFGVTLDSWRNNISILEHLRNKRNSIGHAYGRDISKSRQFMITEKMPIEGVSDKVLMDFFDAVFKVAKGTDNYLLEKHIGEYQFVLAYHSFLQTQHPQGGLSEKAYAFRKFFGHNYKERITRQFCIDLATLYDSF